MAGTETTIRRARKDHVCSEHSYHAIRPGDLYLYAAMPPWHEMARGKTWWVIRACLRCADRYGLHTSDTRKQVEAAHGVANQLEPVLRPVQEGGDVRGAAVLGGGAEGAALPVGVPGG